MLFDLAIALGGTAADPSRIVAAFATYMEQSGNHVTRAQFERNMAFKLRDPQFGTDIGALLAYGHQWDMGEAAQKVSARLIALLPGAPWKGEG